MKDKPIKEQLEELLEKLLNKRGFKCPAGHGRGRWEYAGSKELDGHQEAQYKCLNCDNTFYHKFLKFYNNAQ